MAWEDVMVPMLRVLINDVGDTLTYTDERLAELLLVAAQFVYQELDFVNTYTINIPALTLSPDPTSSGTKEDAFTNLVVLKAACLADQGLYRSKAAVAGIRAKCGPAVLETGRHIEGFKTLLELGPCKAYSEMKFAQQIGRTPVVEAVLSPFTSNNFDPNYLSDGYIYDRERMY